MQHEKGDDSTTKRVNFCLHWPLGQVHADSEMRICIQIKCYWHSERPSPVNFLRKWKIGLVQILIESSNFSDNKPFETVFQRSQFIIFIHLLGQGCKWHYKKFSENAGVQGPHRPWWGQGATPPGRNWIFTPLQLKNWPLLDRSWLKSEG